MAADLGEVDARRCASAAPAARSRSAARRRAPGRRRRRSAGSARARPRRAAARARNSSGVERREEVDREHRRADRGRELGAALDAGARLVVEPLDADERAARPGDRRLGREGELAARRSPRASSRPRALDRGVVGDVGRHEASSSPRQGPPASRSAIWLRLGRGLEQRDGGGASRHRAVHPPRAGGRQSLVAASARPPRSSRSRPAGRSPSRRLDRRFGACRLAHELGRTQERGGDAARERRASRSSGPRRRSARAPARGRRRRRSRGRARGRPGSRSARPRARARRRPRSRRWRPPRRPGRGRRPRSAGRPSRGRGCRRQASSPRRFESAYGSGGGSTPARTVDG